MNTFYASASLLVVVLSGGCAGTKMSGASGNGGQAGAVSMVGSGGAGGGGGGTAGTGPGTAGSIGTAGTSGGPGAGGGGGTDRTCGIYQFNPTPKNADILLVLDRSESMEDPLVSDPTMDKWQILVPTLDSVVTATDSSVLWGMKSFPEGSVSSCAAGSVTASVDQPIAAMNATAVTGAINTTTPKGNGTPTGDAINAAVTYLRSLSDTNPKYIVLATDGQPSCAATPSGESTSAAKPYAVNAVMAAKTAGFPTFVIGVATSSSDTSTLNLMADAGGEVPAGASNPLAPHFYLASDMATLEAALDSITGQISSCLFPLATPPPVPNDPTKLGVYLGPDLHKIPYDPNMLDGWAYTDTNDSAVEVFGSWCTMIQTAGAGAVQIKYGCMNIDVP